MALVTATAEIGSSRTPGRQWIVSLRRNDDGRRLVIVANLSQVNAEHLAERANEFFDDRPGLARTCAVCDKPIAQPGTGRPRMYCSDACKHVAHRDRLAKRP
jgi:hypothetical protein